MLSTIADIVSLVGFGVTIYVAYTVWRIEQAYVRQAIVFQCVPKLVAITRNIRGAITRVDEGQVREELQRAKAILEEVLPHAAHHQETRNAIAEISRILTYQGTDLRAAGPNALEIIVGETERLRLLKLNLQWSRKNG
jgi:hypothetical protein